MATFRASRVGQFITDFAHVGDEAKDILIFRTPRILDSVCESGGMYDKLYRQ